MITYYIFQPFAFKFFHMSLSFMSRTYISVVSWRRIEHHLRDEASFQDKPHHHVLGQARFSAAVVLIFFHMPLSLL